MEITTDNPTNFKPGQSINVYFPGYSSSPIKVEILSDWSHIEEPDDEDDERQFCYVKDEDGHLLMIESEHGSPGEINENWDDVLPGDYNYQQVLDTYQLYNLNLPLKLR